MTTLVKIGPTSHGRPMTLEEFNAAEGAGRVTRADKGRCFTIARAEACEACAAVEIAVAAGDAQAESLEAVLALGDRFVATTTALIR